MAPRGDTVQEALRSETQRTGQEPQLGGLGDLWAGHRQAGAGWVAQVLAGVVQRCFVFCGAEQPRVRRNPGHWWEKESVVPNLAVH